jgi:hypothetical protein
MPLEDLNLLTGRGVPGDVRSFLRVAERRVRRFRRARPIPAFIPCDYAGAYRVLRALAAADPAPGRLFCEWGSGFGVVTCLAAMLDFDACGIEIEGELVDAAQELADDFGLPAEFVRGSFIPPGGETHLGADRFGWLTPDGGDAAGALGLAPDDFDVIFAYPWPDEERLTRELFECYAAPGAVLVTYHAGDGFRLRRKTGGRPAGP